MQSSGINIDNRIILTLATSIIYIQHATVKDVVDGKLNGVFLEISAVNVTTH